MNRSHCTICSAMYDGNDPRQLAKHEHPEPTEGPAFDYFHAWRDVGIGLRNYMSWTRLTPEGIAWAQGFAEVRGDD